MSPVTFSTQWAQEVADISGDLEFQNCTIQVRNPTLLVRVGTITTGYTYTGNPVVWTGRARIASTRSSVNSGGATSTDPTSIKSVRVQVPYDAAFIRVQRGWQIRVTDGGRNPRLEDYLLTVESDVNSSHVASLTFDCTIDVESSPVWV